MEQQVTDVFTDLGYFGLYDKAEQARWNISEIPWTRIDTSKVTADIVHNVKVSAFGELTTFSATKSFMQLFEDDVDFTQWLAVWFYEETRHPHAFIRWLNLVGIAVDEKSLHSGRQISGMTDSKTEMLTFNIVSEIVASDMYHCFRQMTEEPVLVAITKNLARDEMRHSQGFEYYCKKYIQSASEPDQERLRCLRATWFALRVATSGRAQHPVFKTLTEMRGIDTEALRRRVSERVVSRVGKMLDIEIAGADRLYPVYVEFRKRVGRSVPKVVFVS